MIVLKRASFVSKKSRPGRSALAISMADDALASWQHETSRPRRYGAHTTRTEVQFRHHGDKIPRQTRDCKQLQIFVTQQQRFWSVIIRRRDMQCAIYIIDQQRAVLQLDNQISIFRHKYLKPRTGDSADS